MLEGLIIQQPAGMPQQLILLFHGVGGTAHDMAPLGNRIAQAFPNAFVVAINAPQAADAGGGLQWFSLRGITDGNRPQRVAAALPPFLQMVRRWQELSGVGAAATALLGFSQGAIMALEAAQLDSAIAGRVIAFGGRYATLPQSATRALTLHLFHGKVDPVIPYAHTVMAAEHILALGGDVTADVVPFVGHEINPEMADLLIERLTTYIPRRVWDEALSDAGAMPIAQSTRNDH